MPTPASGTISLSNVNTEIGVAATTARDMSWVRSNTKDTASSLGSIYNRAWYQKNNAGNCNNGNCNCGGNCGNIQCGQCFASQCINCTNCDARAWLQGNCNCACTYNCNANLFSYNCNCACACDCANNCFPAGALVLMWSGAWRPIEKINAGDLLMGADGTAARVLRLHTAALAQRQMFRFAEDPKHEWTNDHLHWARKNGVQWWWAASPDQWRWQEANGHGRLDDSKSILHGPDFEYAHLDGFVQRTFERVSRPSDTPVYLPITAGTPIIVNSYVVEAQADEQSYDYEQFSWNPEAVKAKTFYDFQNPR
jgi:hypothetical protein